MPLVALLASYHSNHSLQRQNLQFKGSFALLLGRYYQPFAVGNFNSVHNFSFQQQRGSPNEHTILKSCTPFFSFYHSSFTREEGISKKFNRSRPPAPSDYILTRHFKFFLFGIKYSVGYSVTIYFLSRRPVGPYYHIMSKMPPPSHSRKSPSKQPPSSPSNNNNNIDITLLSLSTLPRELHMSILTFLRAIDLSALQRTCRAFHSRELVCQVVEYVAEDVVSCHVVVMLL